MSFSFFPQIVYKVKSKISGGVVVKEQFGRSTLHVQGLIQSGGIIEGIWRKPLKRVKKVSRVLVLGLGGGTAIQLIKERNPGAEIVSVEIDPEIIKVGKKFFGLGGIKNLKIIKADALKWVNHYQGEKFDLVLVDLYVGSQFPQEAEGKEFLDNLKRMLAKNGMVIFNRLRAGEVNLKSFKGKLERCYSGVELMRTPTNFFFFARS
jgi:spermidine synthase